ncbi:MAG: cellulose biosynthesis cyclic di-GMP-binding regulatory protein BcsB [Chloroflexota bacterium]
MKRISLHALLALTAGLLLAQAGFQHGAAQVTTPTPGPAPQVTAAPGWPWVPIPTAATTNPAAEPGPSTVEPAAPDTPVGALTHADLLTLEQLGEREFVLNGPYDSHSLSFGLPGDWSLADGAGLELFLAAAFRSGERAGAAAGLPGGVLNVYFNDELLRAVQLDQAGSREELLAIPFSALDSTRGDGRHELKLVLDSGQACAVDQQLNVTVRSSSRFSFPHSLVAPSTDLTLFPRPLFHDAAWLDSAVIVVPEHPSAPELQSALTVAAGLGNLTGGELALKLVTAANLTPEVQAGSHLVLVGKAGSLALLNELPLPMPLQGQAFPPLDASADDGVLQMVNSPWSLAKVVLVVSGNSDAAVVKAAQALSTGALRPNTQPNLALVANVLPQPAPLAIPVDQTLAGLGYREQTFDRVGDNDFQYSFVVPAGQAAQPEAYVDLAYSHSELLNYERSGLVALLNDQPIGSVRFSDQTSRKINRARIAVPASVLLPGKNTLELRADLLPRDSCTSPELVGLWATVWSESNLHLPLQPFAFKAEQVFDLAGFPYPFTLNPSLGDTAFVLPHDDLQTWNVALQLAAYLGYRSHGPLVALQAYYPDALPEAAQQANHLLLVGRPSQFPLLQSARQALPAPFEAGSDIAMERGMPVAYRVPGDARLGYLQLFSSPWNKARVVLGVLGSSPDGLQSAGNALIQAPLQARLSGNFAVLRNRQLLTADTRLLKDQPQTSAGFVPVEGSSPELTGSADPLQAAAPGAQRPLWVLLAALGVMLLIVALLGVRAWLHARRAA